jgi:hypothetical protein
MAKRLSHSVFGLSLRDSVPEELTDQQKLIYIAAYQTGYEAGVAAAPAPPAHTSIQPEPPPPQRTARVGQPVDIPAPVPQAQTDEWDGPPADPTVVTAEAIGPYPPEQVAEVMRWVQGAVPGAMILPAQALARKLMGEWGETSESLPPYQKILQTAFRSRKILPDATETPDVQELS